MLVSLLYFLVLAQQIINQKTYLLDYLFFNFFKSITCDTNTLIAKFFSWFGTGTFLIPVYMLIVYVLVKIGFEKYAVFVSVTVVTSLLSGWLLKLIYHRMRPTMHLISGAGWYSFPSGHAQGAFTFCGILLFLIWKASIKVNTKILWSVLSSLFAIAIGLSRIYLHVHYATDVLGSLFFTVFLMSFVYIFFRLLYGLNLHQKRNMPLVLHEPPRPNN